MPKEGEWHLTQGDRMFIEERLGDLTSTPDIARKLGFESQAVRCDRQSYPSANLRLIPIR